jgi:hypothetical protein
MKNRENRVIKRNRSNTDKLKEKQRENKEMKLELNVETEI